MKNTFKTLMALAASLSGAAICLNMTACEKAVRYAIQFENEDGTVLQLSNFNEGDNPTFNGEVPTKAEDENNTYVFDKWLPAIESVSEDMIYTASFRAIPKEKPVLTDVKSALTFIKDNKNFTLSYEANGGFDILFTDDSIGFCYGEDSGDSFIYFDGKGTFEIDYDYQSNTYLSSIYRTDKGVYESGLMSNFYGKSEKFINSIPEGETKIEITDKIYKIAFAEAIGLHDYDSLNISSLVAEIGENELKFNMSYAGYDFKFAAKDFGTTVNTSLTVLLAKGQKVFKLNKALQKLNDGIMSDNYIEQMYRLNIEDGHVVEETTGYYAYSYFTDKYYLTRYGDDKSATLSGYIYLNAPETEKHPAYDGTYMINYSIVAVSGGWALVDNQMNISPLPINSTMEFRTACFYPSTSLLFNNLQYLRNWVPKWFEHEGTTYSYIPKGTAYCTDNPAILEDSINIFGLNSFIEGGATISAIGIDIQLNEQGELEEVMVVAGILYNDKIFNFYMPFFGFGESVQGHAEALLKSL